jgi:hypothetical protein
MKLVADSNKFTNNERLAVDFAKSSIGFCLGTFGVVWQDVGDDAFVASFCGVIDSSVSSRAEAFDNGARSSPGRNVFRPSAGIQKLALSRRHAYFNFFTDLKNTTTAFFI